MGNLIQYLSTVAS